MRVGDYAMGVIRDKKTGTPVADVSFRVERSGAFQYGNQTFTIVTVENYKDGNNIDTDGFDTRYFVGDIKEFVNAWSEDYLNLREVELGLTLVAHDNLDSVER